MLGILKSILALIQGLPLVDLTSLDEISSNQAFLDGLSAITNCVGYFIPVNQLITLIIIDIAFSIFHVTWSIIVRVKTFFIN